MNLLFLSGFQLILFSPNPLTEEPCMVYMKLNTACNSWTWKHPPYRNLHPKKDPISELHSATLASLSRQNLNNSRKLTARGVSPQQQSCQNFNPSTHHQYHTEYNENIRLYKCSRLKLKKIKDKYISHDPQFKKKKMIRQGHGCRSVPNEVSLILRRQQPFHNFH